MNQNFIEKRLFEEKGLRAQLKAETTTRRKLTEMQTFLSQFEKTSSYSNQNLPDNYRRQADPDQIASFDRVKDLLETLKLENKILKETIETLKQKSEDSIVKQRLELEKITRENQANLTKAQQEFDRLSITKTRQIEELIEDKRILTRQMETLTEKLLELDRVSIDKIQAIKQQSAEEIKRVKADFEAQLQIKFKNWKEKTRRELKETTIRGLEPELDKLMKRNDDEKMKIRAHYETLLKNQEDSMAQRVQDLIAIEKEKLATESASSLEKDRQVLQAKFASEKEWLIKNYQMELVTTQTLSEKEARRF